jgi:hypothetical protein
MTCSRHKVSNHPTHLHVCLNIRPPDISTPTPPKLDSLIFPFSCNTANMEYNRASSIDPTANGAYASDDALSTLYGCANKRSTASIFSEIHHQSPLFTKDDQIQQYLLYPAIGQLVSYFLYSSISKEVIILIRNSLRYTMNINFQLLVILWATSVSSPYLSSDPIPILSKK